MLFLLLCSKYGTISGTSNEFYLKDITTPQNMVKERYESVSNFMSGIKRIEADEKYAFVWDEPSMDYFLSENPSDISNVPHYRLDRVCVSMFVQKNSEFKEIFNF